MCGLRARSSTFERVCAQNTLCGQQADNPVLLVDADENTWIALPCQCLDGAAYSCQDALNLQDHTQ